MVHSDTWRPATGPSQGDTLILGLGALVVLLAVAGLGGFVLWRRRLLARILRNSEIARTAKGPVEFACSGKGPVILQVHGGATGCDQTLALSWDFHEAGFTVLTPSRPGYLRTPLASGPTPEEAADALASLLDVLGINRVAAMGTSGGGPTALQFALRHPRRVWGLVLQSAVTRQFVEPRRSTHSLLGRVVFSRSGKWLVDLGSCGIALLARCWPGLLVRTFFNASEDLAPGKAKERRAYVLGHPEQLGFFRRLTMSGLPLSVRQAGIRNDLRQYARLPVYPLERIQCPTLVLHGRADGNVPFAHAEFVAGTVAGAELHAIEDCGHLIWVGPAAAQTREAVLAFLRRQVPAAGGTAPSEVAALPGPDQAPVQPDPARRSAVPGS
jgi:LPXTG-motif cell wall-anchored protein